MMQYRLPLISAALALLVTACASAPARFYTLAQPASAAQDAQRDRAGQTLIEVLPVAVPERLARPQLVVRSDDARVEILEQDRWSAPFHQELRDALAVGIAHRVGAANVTRGGRPPHQPVYRIAVDLRQLDAVQGDQVEATFGWAITRSDNINSVVCRLTIREPVQGVGIDGLVRGMQRVVAHAADAIAADLAGMRDSNISACRR